MPITAERLEVDVTADTSKARSELGKFDKSTQATAASAGKAGGSAKVMGGKFSAAATLVKAAAGAMAVSFAGKTIMAASDLNEVISKTGVVFGPQAEKVTDAAQKMADQFGISKAVYLDAASGIGLVGKASGLTQKAAAGLSTDFAALAADASSFYDVPITDALAAMKSGLVGESEPMRQFGVLLSESAVKAEAARLGIAKMGDELTEGQKVQARASLITKGMSDASGDLARTQESVANRLREIRGRVTNFAADMGSKALPVVEKFLSVMIDAPGKIMDAANAIRNYVTNNATFAPALAIAKTAVEGLVGVVKAVPGVFSTVVDSVREFVSENQWVKTVLDQAALAVGAFIAAFAAVVAVQKVLGVIKAVRTAVLMLNAAMMANPVALVVAAVVALGVVLYAAYQRFEGFRKVVDTTAAALRDGFTAAIDWVKAKWAEFGPSIMKGVQVVKDVIVGLFRFMLPIWKAQFQAMVGIAKAVWKMIGGVIKGALKIIQGIVNVVMGVIRGDWGRAWKGIQQILSGAWGVIKSLVSGGINLLKAVISGGLGVIKAVWSGAWNALKTLVSAAWERIKSAVSSGIQSLLINIRLLPGKITGALGALGSLLYQAGKDLIQGLINGVGDMAGALTGKLQDMAGSAISAAKNVFGIKSPSRVFRKIGTQVVQGLVVGIRKDEKKARKAAANMATKVIGAYMTATRKGGKTLKRFRANLLDWSRDVFSGKNQRRLVKDMRSQGKRLRTVMERESRITRNLRQALAQKDDLKEQRKNLVSAMSGGISSQANVLNAGNNAGTIRESLQAQVAKAKEFVGNLKAMKAMGYSREVIAQVAAAGIESGNEVAKALASANLDDMAGINSAFSEINQIAKAESKAMGASLYNSGIQAANGLVQGLKKRKKDVEKTLESIALGMVKALKKALGIKSPSRIMASMGAFAGEGLAKGLEGMRRRVSKAGQEMGVQATQGVQMGLDTTFLPRGPGDGPSNPFTPASTGGTGAKREIHFTFITHNPKGEPQSRTTNKALDRVATLGLV